jgi:hypothetical protein
MSDPDDVRFACIGCGTFNASTSEFCDGCGHRFAGTDVISPVRVVLPPRRSLDDLSKIRISFPRTFQIGTIAAWIAVIAVCLAAFRADWIFGSIVSLSILPATFWTSIIVGSRRAQGLPVNFEVRASQFIESMAVSWFILFACVIAFAVTVFVTAFLNPGVAMVVGIVAVIFVGSGLIRAFFKGSRDRAREEYKLRRR